MLTCVHVKGVFVIPASFSYFFSHRSVLSGPFLNWRLFITSSHCGVGKMLFHKNMCGGEIGLVQQRPGQSPAIISVFKCTTIPVTPGACCHGNVHSPCQRPQIPHLLHATCGPKDWAKELNLRNIVTFEILLPVLQTPKISQTCCAILFFYLTWNSITIRIQKKMQKTHSHQEQFYTEKISLLTSNWIE